MCVCVCFTDFMWVHVQTLVVDSMYNVCINVLIKSLCAILNTYRQKDSLTIIAINMLLESSCIMAVYNVYSYACRASLCDAEMLQFVISHLL